MLLTIICIILFALISDHYTRKFIEYAFSKSTNTVISVVSSTGDKLMASFNDVKTAVTELRDAAVAADDKMNQVLDLIQDLKDDLANGVTEAQLDEVMSLVEDAKTHVSALTSEEDSVLI